ncbi:kinase-like domain-containing protein [Ephemerocybe angulata]|uniref:Kinase-like domain-containing protein n=1 Tax=Ephemerocybe angulata TaxID=980116 RepID=A0A8H6M171_9AGAR|nr:kinase-like domain-containing protein [Tulosesus angulatus]
MGSAIPAGLSFDRLCGVPNAANKAKKSGFNDKSKRSPRNSPQQRHFENRSGLRTVLEASHDGAVHPAVLKAPGPSHVEDLRSGRDGRHGREGYMGELLGWIAVSLAGSKEQVQDWSDKDIFAYFRDPYVYGSPERQLVDCIDTYKLLGSYFLQEDIILADFKHSFNVRRPLPPGHPLGTLTHYMSPELRFDGRIGLPSDIWALACVIFEVRTGSPLFDEWSGEEGVRKSVVRFLGEPPEAWQGPEDGSLRVDERAKGLKLPDECQEDLDSRAETSIMQELEKAQSADEGGRDVIFAEATRVQIEKEELELLADLLKQMLRYLPEERPSIDEVLSHPWFKNEDAHRPGGSWF